MIDAMVNDGDIIIMRPASTARSGEMVAIWLPSINGSNFKVFFQGEKPLSPSTCQPYDETDLYKKE